MASHDGKGNAQEQDASRKAAATDPAQDATATPEADQVAARRPVRAAKAAPKGGANRGKPAKANAGNRASRAVREKGANKADKDEPGKDEDEEEEEDEERRAADKFWQLMVAGSYSSRKARDDCGGGTD